MEQNQMICSINPGNLRVVMDLNYKETLSWASYSNWIQIIKTWLPEVADQKINERKYEDDNKLGWKETQKMSMWIISSEFQL